MPALVALTDRVLVATSAEEQMTTTVLVGNDGCCLVVDAGGTPEEMAALAKEIGERGLRPVAAWSTHGHWRHVLWHSSLGAVPRYTTATAAAWVADHLDDLVAAADKSALGYELELVGQLTPLGEDDTELPWDGPETMIGPLSAHAAGQGVLVVPELAVLVAGDFCSDVQVPLVDLEAEHPFDDYRTVLAVLADLEDIEHIIPGHGTPCGPEELARRVALDRAYLDDILAGRPSGDERLKDAPGWLLDWHEAQAKLAVEAAVVEEPTAAPSGPIDVSIPADVETQLGSVLAALERLDVAARPFLEGDHLDVAGIAARLEPVASAADLDVTEALVAAWREESAPRLAALRTVVELADRHVATVRGYAAAMREVFADAVEPATPAEESPAEGAGG